MTPQRGSKGLDDSWFTVDEQLTRLRSWRRKRRASMPRRPKRERDKRPSPEGEDGLLNDSWFS